MGTEDREAEQVALAFAAKGYHAFVLRYSCGGAAQMPQPILDGFRAVAYICSHAAEWRIHPLQITVCGFSAGGHLASCMATMWHWAELAGLTGHAPLEIRPDAVVLGYPCIALPNPSPGQSTGCPAEKLDSLLAGLENPDAAGVYFVRGGMGFPLRRN